MRIKITISLLVTFLGFFAFLEIFEYINKNNKSFYEKKVLEVSSIEENQGNKINRELDYKLLQSNLDLKFEMSENKEEWLRELMYIENKGSNKNMTNHIKLDGYVTYNSKDLYNVNYTGDIKDKTAKKILLVGDSFVGGFAQERYNLNYSSILKEMMGNNETLNKYEIFSVGKSGSFHTYLRTLENYYDIIKPDMVIIGFLSNDYKADVSVNESSKYIDCLYGNNLLNSTIAIIPKRYKLSKDEIKEFFCDRDLTEEINSKLAEEKDKTLFDNALKKMKKRFGGENIIIANTEPPILLNHSYAFERFKEENINVIKMKETYDLLGYTNNLKLYINPYDWHPAPELSYVYALDIFNYLLNNKPHEKNTSPKTINNSITSVTNGILSNEAGSKTHIIEKTVDVNNYYKQNTESLSITGSRTDLYQKAEYPLQISYCAKFNRPYDVYEFAHASKFKVSLVNSEYDSLFMINYYFENGKIVEEYNLLSKGSSLEINKDSLGLIVATPYSGCALDKSIDTGLYKIEIAF